MAATTWNPADKLNANLTNGNLTATWPGNNFSGARSTTSHATGKYYFEFHTIAISGDFHLGNDWLGLAPAVYSLGSQADVGASGFIGVTQDNQTAGYFPGHFNPANGDPEGHVLCIAIDFDAQLFWCRNDAGNWNNSGTANPATGTGGSSYSTSFSVGTALFICCCLTTISVVCNATIAPSPASFLQTMPSGFTAWDDIRPITRSFGTIIS